MTSAIFADQNLAGNVTVTGGAATGNLNVTGTIDNYGNSFVFGTQGSSFGGALLYQDNNVDTFTFSTNRNPASWLWQHNTAIKAMRLDSAHQLLLYQADGSTAGITLAPAANSISLGTATLTANGTTLSTNGPLTVAGNLTNTTGAFTGGATGLALNAGGTGQNITLSSSGAGDIVFNTNGVERARINSAGNVGIGTGVPGFKLDVAGIGQFSGGTQIGNGATVGLFNDGANLGVRAPSAPGDIYFQTAGGAATNMIIKNGGNVGIGTNNPSSQAHLLGPAGTAAPAIGGGTLYLQDNGGAPSNGGALLFGAAQGYWAGFKGLINNGSYGTTGDLALFTRNAATDAALTERLRVVQNGNVGIGTATPGFKLHVVGVVSSDQGANVFTTLGLDPGASASPTTYGGLYFDVNKNLRLEALSGGVAWRNIILQGQGSGSVGIGTTNPSSQLHLYGAAGTAAPVVGGGALYLQDSGAAVNNGGALLFGAAQGYWAGVKGLINNGSNSTTGDIAFFTRNVATDAALTERLRILQNGNVGIGTASPTQKLAVNGTIRAKEVIVDTGWSDYVFDNSYRLAPLSEVEQRIKADGHLPGIPSAWDVAEHGVSMGDMQSKLLAKVEELTLHLIAQEKQLAAQSARIDQLERDNAALQNH